MRAQSSCKPLHEPLPQQAWCGHRALGAGSPYICCIWLLGLDQCCSARLQVAVRAWAPWSAQ